MSMDQNDIDSLGKALRQAADANGTGPMTPDAKAELRPWVVMYRNYRGEISERRIVPKSVRFGSTEWHPEPGWLLLAFDLDKQADREFALADFISRTPPPAAEVVEREDHAKWLRDWAQDMRKYNGAVADPPRLERIAELLLSSGAASVPEGWRPMDDAPTHGGQVLLYGHWKQFHGTAHESNHVNCGHYANGWVCEGRYNEDFIAVAWQPMPLPPAAAPKG